MPDIRLSMALSHYDPTLSGCRAWQSSRYEGITLIPICELPVEEIFFPDGDGFAEWDVAECSMAKYVALVGTGPRAAIPRDPGISVCGSLPSIFFLCRHRLAGIAGPRDLVGRRIRELFLSGRRLRAFMRALIFEHQCGVSLREIQVEYSLASMRPDEEEKVNLRLPGWRVSVERVADRSLNDMLLAGDLDGHYFGART